jgi:hypothetical protein
LFATAVWSLKRPFWPVAGLAQDEEPERSGSARDDTNRWYKMTRTELIIQLLKVAIGLALGAYFVWWSLEVLDRLTPDNGVPTAVVGRI